jgi:mono/diheme cytochrome c family protein
MSCVGCHEPRGTTPTAQATVAGRRVLDIEPPPGARHGGGFSFARSVQPVLDRHCIKCHGLERTEADLTLLGTPTAQFSVAYESLVSRPGLVKLAHPYQETDVSHVKDYGAHAGRLGPLLLTGYREKGRMDREGFARIAEWLDLNGQYYGDYSFSRAERREPNAEGLTALRAHVQQSCGACHPGLADQPFAALANTAAPDESRLLQAHLAEAAGGWGQCGEAWPDRAAAGYLALREKVLAATGPADGLP